MSGNRNLMGKKTSVSFIQELVLISNESLRTQVFVTIQVEKKF